MATIGTFKKNGDEITGTLETLTLRANITLSPNAKTKDNAPDYRVFQQAKKFTSEIGAAWKKSAKDGSEYLSVTLDDPSVIADCNVTHLVEVKVDHLGDDGGFGTADADSGANSGDTGVEASGLEYSSDRSRDRSVACDGAAIFGGAGGSGALRAA